MKFGILERTASDDQNVDDDKSLERMVEVHWVITLRFTENGKAAR
jgi:hypothetical protein